MHFNESNPGPGAGVLDDILQLRPYNAASDFVDANVARGLSDKVAFADPDRSLTYGELQARSVNFAWALQWLGVAQENRVALLLYDTVDFPVAFWGAIRAGVVAVPVNTLLTPEQHAYVLADSRAAAIVVTASLAESILALRRPLPHLRHVIVAGAGARDMLPAGVHRFDDLIGGDEAEPFTAATISDEVAFWLYSSGSTGEPKAVRHVHASLMATARLMGQGILGIGED